MTYDDLEPFYQEAEEIIGASGADNTGSPRNKPLPMEPVAEPYVMRRLRKRLASDYPVVSNTTTRNSHPYDRRPAYCGNNSCQLICLIGVQYHDGLAVDAAEVKLGFPTPMSISSSMTRRATSRQPSTTTPIRPRIGQPGSRPTGEARLLADFRQHGLRLQTNTKYRAESGFRPDISDYSPVQAAQIRRRASTRTKRTRP